MYPWNLPHQLTEVPLYCALEAGHPPLKGGLRHPLRPGRIRVFEAAVLPAQACIEAALTGMAAAHRVLPLDRWAKRQVRLASKIVPPGAGEACRNAGRMMGRGSISANRHSGNGRHQPNSKEFPSLAPPRLRREGRSTAAQGAVPYWQRIVLASGIVRQLKISSRDNKKYYILP